MARELNYTLADFMQSENLYSLGLWRALKSIEAQEARKQELKDKALKLLHENDGRFTRGIRI